MNLIDIIAHAALLMGNDPNYLHLQHIHLMNKARLGGAGSDLHFTRH